MSVRTGLGSAAPFIIGVRFPKGVEGIKVAHHDEKREVQAVCRDRSLDVSDLSEYHRMLRPEVRARLEGGG